MLYKLITLVEVDDDLEDTLIVAEDLLGDCHSLIAKQGYVVARQECQPCYRLPNGTIVLTNPDNNATL